MDLNSKVKFVRVTKVDVDEMTVVMKKAFDEDARRHQGREAGGPPGCEN